MRKVTLGLVLILTCFLISCNAVQSGFKAQGVISAILKVASAECPFLPSQDQAACKSWTTLGTTLDGQLAGCLTKVSGVMGMGTGSKVVACFDVFANGLMSPQELAQLRIISGPSQQKVQLWVTAISIGVNLITAFTTPTVSATVPTAQELHDLGIQAGIPEKEFSCRIPHVDDNINLAVCVVPVN